MFARHCLFFCFLILGFLTFPKSWSREDLLKLKKTIEYTIHSRGVTYHIDHYPGEGETVVISHGVFFDKNVMDGMAEYHLNKGRNVFVFSLRGHGQGSEVSSVHHKGLIGSYSFDAVMGDFPKVFEFIWNLSGKRPMIFIGWSLSAVAMIYGYLPGHSYNLVTRQVTERLADAQRRQKEMISKVILYAMPTGREVSKLAAMSSRLGGVVLKNGDQGLYRGRLAPRMVSNLTGLSIPHSDLVSQFVHSMRDGPIVAQNGLAYEDYLERVRIPILFVGGEIDHITSGSESLLYLRERTRAPVNGVIYGRIGHFRLTQLQLVQDHAKTMEGFIQSSYGLPIIENPSPRAVGMKAQLASSLESLATLSRLCF